MRFSAISSRVKLCVSSSTFEGSLVAAGRVGFVVLDDVDGMNPVEGELQRNTLPSDCQKEDVEAGMEAVLRVAESSVSTAALRQ